MKGVSPQERHEHYESVCGETDRLIAQSIRLREFADKLALEAADLKKSIPARERKHWILHHPVIGRS